MTAPSVPGGSSGLDMVERVRIQVADRLTTNLRDTTSKAGWPHQLVMGTRVVWTGKTWQIDIDDHARAAVDDLEYGSQARQPNPVLRKFAARMGSLADKAASASLLDLGEEVLA